MKKAEKHHKMLRQGDVLLKQVSKEDVPSDGLNQKDEKIVAYGEVSGHVHQIFGDQKTELYEDDNGVQYLFVPEGEATIEHVREGTREQAEHDGISLPGGTFWKVTIQREYNPYEKEINRVKD